MRPSSLLVSLLPVALALAAYTLDRTSEKGEAQITNPAQECTAYSYPPVSQAIAARKFPPIWTPATIVGGDTAAMTKYQSIQSQIPNIPPNGQQPASLQGNWTGFAYPPSDPNCWWSYGQCTTPKHSGLPPDFTVVPEPDTLGYGFDDGPNCSHNAFYDFLQRKNQKATMFYIGSNVIDWPLEAQRGIADGHEICVHTWSHRYMTALTNEEVFAEFYYTMEAIKLVVGVTPTCWRPPFGDVDDRVRAFAHALGLRTILWKYDSNDWRAGTANITAANVDANYQALIQRAENGTFSAGGSIMLTHELNNFTMSEAIKFYDQLKSAFKYIVPMGVAANISQPYVETNYSQPNFEQYIAGTTTLSGGVAAATGGSSQASSHGAAAQSYATIGGLMVSAAFVGSMLRLLM